MLSSYNLAGGGGVPLGSLHVTWALSSTSEIIIVSYFASLQMIMEDSNWKSGRY